MSMANQCKIIDGSLCQYFQCPCGRTYKSYPALYTHIKNKHDGKAPGVIRKPACVSKKRGRPSSHKISSQYSQNQQQKSSQPNSLPSQFNEENNLTNDMLDNHYIQKIAKILRSYPRETLNKSNLNEINSILQMNVYLISSKNQMKGLYIGNIISQFLQLLSQQVDWQRFQHIYTLMMLLIQYIMDELNNTNIIKQGPVDLLCDFVNDFIEIGAQGMIRHYSVGNVSILKQDNMVEILQSFFQWLMVKKYTNYKIELNCGFKKVQTTYEF